MRLTSEFGHRLVRDTMLSGIRGLDRFCNPPTAKDASFRPCIGIKHARLAGRNTFLTVVKLNSDHAVLFDQKQSRTKRLR